ncbi:transcriptional regulator [Streptomyces sp. L2]|uniref:transcriptional regulator n=1 Tax=Streptomyces sp. L2 TaxID=2162665 RepID=UPI001F50F401|nr:transcriptional regulator [Streptomyces sp. L2]
MTNVDTFAGSIQLSPLIQRPPCDLHSGSWRSAKRRRIDSMSSLSDVVRRGGAAYGSAPPGVSPRSLELAGAAEDHLTYCTTLRGMSVQAIDLRHGTKAMELADVAAAASPKAGPRMRAFLAGQQAHAAAQTGNRAAAMRYIREAEEAMDRAESRGKAFGSYDPAALNYHISQVRYELGDVSGAIEAMQESDKVRYSVYRRARVRHRGTLAERKLEIGHLDAACAIWHQALDDYPMVQSARADDRIRTMFGLLRPHLKNPTAHDLYERARTIAPPSLVT